MLVNTAPSLIVFLPSICSSEFHDAWVGLKDRDRTMLFSESDGGLELAGSQT